MSKSRTIDMGRKTKVIDLVRKLGINPETIIARRGDEILLESERLRKNDTIELIRIISGG